MHGDLVLHLTRKKNSKKFLSDLYNRPELTKSKN